MIRMPTPIVAKALHVTPTHREDLHHDEGTRHMADPFQEPIGRGRAGRADDACRRRLRDMRHDRSVDEAVGDADGDDAADDERRHRPSAEIERKRHGQAGARDHEQAKRSQARPVEQQSAGVGGPVGPCRGELGGDDDGAA